MPVVFEGVAAAHGARAAVSAGPITLTYDELNRRANQMAHLLRGRGVGPESLVGLCVSRSPDLIVALLGILKAGGAYLPLDPDYPEARLRGMLEDAHGPLVIAERALADRVPEGPHACLILEDLGGDLASQPTGNLPDSPAPGNMAYVMFTSGSTGRPKGVCVEHRSILRLVCGADYARFGPDEVYFQFAPISFDASTFEIWGALLHGARLAIAPPGLPSLADLGKAIAAEGVTVLWLTAGLFNQMVEAGLEDLRGVKQLLSGGDVLSPAHLRRAREALPGTRFTNGYGPTECTTFTCCHDITGPIDGPIPIGTPIANTEVHILDERQQPCPRGEPGELYVGGPGVARGYLGQAQATREVFVPHPFSEDPAARLYRTGDRVCLGEDGALRFLGRLDGQVKIRGYRIETGEIEAALIRHPAVSSAAVRAWGEDAAGKWLAAYVTAAGADRPAQQALRAFLAESLPAHMVPLRFVWLEVLPLNPNGKVDRAALPEPAEAERDGALPRPGLEQNLAVLWRDLLGVDTVYREDDFFDLGGQSLLALRLLNAVHEELGVSMPPSALFEARTLAAFARRVEDRADSGHTETPVTPVSRDGVLPLSFPQEQLWVLDQQTGGTRAYDLHFAFRFRGSLDRAALEQAVTGLVARHEALRTSLPSSEGRPRQAIAAPGPVPLAYDEGPEDDGWLHDLVRTPFDLARGPLSRFVLRKTGEDTWLFCALFHHTIFDGWSLGPFLRDLSELYNAAKASRAPVLPALEVQYADYAAWQQRTVTGAVLEERLSFWRDMLAGAPAALELVTDFPRPEERRHEGAELARTLGAETAAALDGLSRDTRTTAFAVCLAAWLVCLKRATGQADVVVGAPMAGRPAASVEPLIGFFVNTALFRTVVDERYTFRQAVRATHTMALGAHDHQNVSLEDIVRAVRPGRDPSRAPLFQVVFAYQQLPPRKLDFEGLTCESLRCHNGTSKTDLILEVDESPTETVVRLEYDTNLFEEATAAGLLGRYLRFLAAAAASPDTPLFELEWLSEADRRVILREVNATARPFPGEASVPAVFERVVAAHGTRVAISSGDARLTYGELNRRANQMARLLRGRGIGPETLVGLCVSRSPDLIVAVLGILKAGGAYLPLEPGYPEARLRLMLEDARTPVVITERGLADRVPGGPHTCLVLEDLANELAALPGENLPDPPAGGNLAYVMFTSGSTGRPKGVCVEHRSILRLVCGAEYARFGPDEVYFQFAPISFDASTFEIWGALLHGARLAIGPAGLPSLAALGQAIKAEGVTVLWLTAGLFHEMAEEGLQDLGGVKQLLAGGDVLSPAHLRRAREALPDTRFTNGYGPTECTTFTCCHDIHGPIEDNIPIGLPIANTEVYVLDEWRRPCPLGVPGELYIGGPGVAREYLGQPDPTREAFVPHPFSEDPNARLYRTGDRVRLGKDGALRFLGRLDGQVKLRGFRVELGEVEAALGAHPEVRAAAVVAQTGQSGEKHLAAFVVSRDGAYLDGAALRRFLGERLPDHMVPASFSIVPDLPLDPNGKVDRARLARETAPGRPYRPPENPEEEAVAALWAGLLGVARVGRDESFFDLGGTSIQVMRMLPELERILSRTIPAEEIFRTPTIVSLCAETGHPADAKEYDIIPLNETREGTPLFCLVGINQYRPLGAAFEGLCPVYSIYVRREAELAAKRPGDLGEDELAGLMRRLTESYVDAIRDVQPRGPYRLLGFSAGGVAAFEAAKVLEAAGETVETVVPIDTMTRHAFRWSLSLQARAAWRLFRDKSLIEFLWRAPLKAWRVTSGLLRGSGVHREGMDPAELRGDDDLDSLHRYMLAVVSAEFRPVGPTSAHVVVVRAADRSHVGRLAAFTETEHLGWEDCGARELSAHVIPGDHRSLMRAPNVFQLAEVLRAYL